MSVPEARAKSAASRAAADEADSALDFDQIPRRSSGASPDEPPTEGLGVDSEGHAGEADERSADTEATVAVPASQRARDNERVAASDRSGQASRERGARTAADERSERSTAGDRTAASERTKLDHARSDQTTVGQSEWDQTQLAQDPDATAVLPAAAVPEPDEDPAAIRERRRAERDKMLGTRRPIPEPVAEEAPVVKTNQVIVRNTDRFFGSLGLFLLRIVTAAIIGLHGFAKALDITSVQTMLANTIIPEPVIMSFVLTGAEVAIALALLFGVLTRIAGLGLAIIGISALVFVHWITNPFIGNALTGELEILLAAVGLLFLLVGAGGWSVDAAFRRRRVAESA